MKTLKTTIFVIAIIGASMTRCGIKEKLEKNTKARANADFIMDNLNKQEVVDQFPEKYFPREKFKPFLDTLTKHCDFNSKRGKFVDFFNMLNNGKSQTAYIYEYFLNCDSLRFIYIYDFDSKEPELFNLRIEQLEQENKMIIDPKKQLLNSGLK
jgi:hypothetical protein